jgi:predicted branched-subunit amino acid permease
MQTSSTRGAFISGLGASAPFLLVVLPFSMLFGFVATQAGLSVVDTMTFSVVVIAGAAQFAAIGLMQDGAPTVIVLLSALAVNLRMAMYSAALVPHLGGLPLWQRAAISYALFDQTYALSADRFEREPGWSLAQKRAFYAGVAVVIVPLWYVFTLVGALAGTAIPDWIPLDFAVPITFLAVIAPMLRTRAHVAAAVFGVAGALLFAWLPLNLGLIVGALLGMMAGAEAERRGWAEPAR